MKKVIVLILPLILSIAFTQHSFAAQGDYVAHTVGAVAVTSGNHLDSGNVSGVTTTVGLTCDSDGENTSIEYLLYIDGVNVGDNFCNNIYREVSNSSNVTVHLLIFNNGSTSHNIGYTLYYDLVPTPVPPTSTAAPPTNTVGAGTPTAIPPIPTATVHTGGGIQVYYDYVPMGDFENYNITDTGSGYDQGYPIPITLDGEAFHMIWTFGSITAEQDIHGNLTGKWNCVSPTCKVVILRFMHNPYAKPASSSNGLTFTNIDEEDYDKTPLQQMAMGQEGWKYQVESFMTNPLVEGIVFTIMAILIARQFFKAIHLLRNEADGKAKKGRLWFSRAGDKTSEAINALGAADTDTDYDGAE